MAVVKLQQECLASVREKVTSAAGEGKESELQDFSFNVTSLPLIYHIFRVPGEQCWEGRAENPAPSRCSFGPILGARLTGGALAEAPQMKWRAVASDKDCLTSQPDGSPPAAV